MTTYYWDDDCRVWISDSTQQVVAERDFRDRVCEQKQPKLRKATDLQISTTHWKSAPLKEREPLFPSLDLQDAATTTREERTVDEFLARLQSGAFPTQPLATDDLALTIITIASEPDDSLSLREMDDKHPKMDRHARVLILSRSLL